MNTPDGYIMVDSGACDSACMPNAFDEPIDTSQKKRLFAINSTEIKVHGKQTAHVKIGDKQQHNATINFNVTDCTENVVSVANIVDHGGSVVFTPNESWLHCANGNRVELIRCNKRWFLPYTKQKQQGSMPKTDLMAPVNVDEQGWRHLRDFDPDEMEDEEEESLDQLTLEQRAQQGATGPRTLSSPQLPSQEEQDRHNLTHADFAPWCRYCVMGKGKEDPHKRRSVSAGSSADPDIPVIQVDYQFYSREGDQVQGEAKLATVCTAVDCSSGWPLSTMVPFKGRTADHYLGLTLVNWINNLGYKKIIIRIDQESALKSVVTDVQNAIGADVVQIQMSPKSSHASLGAAEGMNGFLAGQVRTWLQALRNKYQNVEQPIDVNHQIFPWLVRHTAWLAARYHPRHDRLTPHRLVKGVEYDSPICQFGECVLARIQDVSQRPKGKPRWIRGIWVGRLETDNSHACLTSEGAMSFRTIRRVPIEQQFDVEVFNTACGLPWSPKQLREKLTPVVSQPVPVFLPAMEPQEAQQLSDDEAEEVADGNVAPAEQPEVAMSAKSSSQSSSSSSSSSSTPSTPLQPPPDVPMTPRTTRQPTSSPPTPFGLNNVTPPQTPSRVNVEEQPQKQQRIAAFDDTWNQVRLWAEAEEINLASQQLGAVMDLLDTQLDKGEVHLARIDELKKLQSLNGFVVTHRNSVPRGAKIFYSKWVDKKSKGIYKSRCTCADVKARYSKQELELETNVFSPTPHPESHVLLEIKALQNHWPMRTADIVSAFLIGRDAGDPNGQPVYMAPPKEFQQLWDEVPSQDKKKLGLLDVPFSQLVWLVEGNIYGRRTAPFVYRAEFEKIITENLKQHGFAFSRGQKDVCVYTCSKTGTVLLHHVDDMRCTGSKASLEKLFSVLQNYVNLKQGDLEVPGTKQQILNKTKLYIDGAIITLPDPKHTDQILRLLNMDNGNKASKVPSKKLELTDETLKPLSPTDAETYRSCVGSAIYLSHDRRDIMYAVKELARQMVNPRVADMANLKTLARYLSGTRGYGKLVTLDNTDPSQPLSFDTFCDSDWAGDTLTRRTTDGVVCVIGGTVVLCSSQTQPGLPATSSADGEIRGCSRAAREIVFLKALATMDFKLNIVSQPRLYTDSAAALAASKRIGLSSKLRHLEVSQVYVQELVHRGDILIRKVAGTRNPSNALTKHLSVAQVNESIPTLGLVNCAHEALAAQLDTAKQLSLASISSEATTSPTRIFPWKPSFPGHLQTAQLTAVTHLV